MPKLYLLVGVPGSGKTTWTMRQQLFDWKKTAYISTDKLVEQRAESTRQSYKDVFESYMPNAVRIMAKEASNAFDAGLDVVWDQTSTTVASRARKLYMTPAHYTKIAVVFRTPPADIHAQWLNRPDKEIPAEFIDNMISQFEEPELKEGFDAIFYIKTSNMQANTALC